MREVALPDKPSALIRLALADLAKVERSKKYLVKMEEAWHTPSIDKCIVCFAGSVMAMTLKAPINSIVIPSDFSNKNQFKLYVLNFLRIGSIEDAINYLDCLLSKKRIEQLRSIFSRKITPYSTDRVEFKRDMRKLAKDFEKIGL